MADSDASFYVYLASNAGDFATNTHGSFRVHLPRKLQLHGQRGWQCALVELSFVRSWRTISDDWRNTPDQIMFVDLGGQATGVRLQSGYFDNAHALCARINDSLAAGDKLSSGSRARAQESDPTLAEWFTAVDTRRAQMGRDQNAQLNTLTFGYNDARNEVVVRRGDPGQVRAVWVNPTVRNLLGIGNRQWFDSPSGEVEEHGNVECDLKAGVDTFYVYTDIIASQIVSNTSAPLLRVVGIPHIKFGERAVITFDSPHYLPVSVSECDTISIIIRSAFGNVIEFQRGEVFVKLHFRPSSRHFVF